MPRTGAHGASFLIGIMLAACASADGSPSVARQASASADPSSSGTGVPPPDARWDRLADAPFARLEMAVAAHDGLIWLAGGLSPLGDALTDVEVFDPGSGTWSDGPSLPSPVHHAALVSDGARLLLIGGYLGSAFNRPTDLVLVLAEGDDAWREGPPLPAARAAGAAAWDGARVVYAGGVGIGVAPDVHVLSDDGWTRIGAMARPREHFAATSDGEGRTWLIGGRIGGLDTNVGTVELVEGDAIALLGSLPTPRGGVAAFFVPGFGACLTGGEAPDRAYRTVECIGTDGSIIPLGDMNEPHHGHGAAVVGDMAYVVLGGPEPTLSAGSVMEALALAALTQ
jgi:Kelch motif